MGMILTMRSTTDEEIASLLEQPTRVHDVLNEDEGVATLDLDKAWHGIHFLLTGTAWAGEPPLHFLVLGGTPIGEEDVGYGPARAFTSGEVRTVRDALTRVTDETLRERFDGPTMVKAEIYPNIWARAPEEDDTLGYLLEYVDALRGFLDALVRDGMGMLLCIS